MKKRYSRKQIQEAINYWQNRLNMMNEASGKIPFQVGDSVVQKVMNGLQYTLFNSVIVDRNELDEQYANNPRKVYIANIGKHSNQPGDILITFTDLSTNSREDVKFEVKSSTRSSLFQFTYHQDDSGLDAQYHYANKYAAKFQEIQSNISNFAAVYMFVNATTPEEKNIAFDYLKSAEHPSLTLDLDNITEDGFYKTLKFIQSFRSARHSSDDKLNQIVLTKVVNSLKPLIANHVGIRFCSSFDIDLEYIKQHFSECQYMRVGKYIYSVNGENPLKLTKNKKQIKSLDSDFNSAKMTCYLKKPSQFNPGFRLICKAYNLHFDSGNNISFDDISQYPDKQKVLVGYNK